MKQPKSSTQYLEEIRPLLRSVPPSAHVFVCRLCLGPGQARSSTGVSWWPQCYPCKKLFERAPEVLQERFVAATIAVDPSPWFGRLQTYKRSAPEYQPLIASVAWQFMNAHRDRFSAMLGGPAEGIVVVPSTKGTPLNLQPLRRALMMAAPLRDLLVAAVQHNGKQVRRQEYAPEAFDVVPALIAGRRLLVIDDTWVTGARLTSVAGALLAAGAGAVVPFAIARDVNDAWCSHDHPYRREMERPYDINAWPRGVQV